VSSPSGRPDIERAGVPTALSGARAPEIAGAPARVLRILAVGLGLAWSTAFVLVGLAFELQFYGDGAFFSYAVAAQDSWLFHWRNIAVRAFVHVFSHLPAEVYVAATGDAAGGVRVYGLLFSAAPLAGLALTFAADRSPGRAVFVGACLSTALLCPLVFGCPTETWFAHALFWPALASCHGAPVDARGAAAVGAIIVALVFTHEGGLIFAGAIVATSALRGVHSHAFVRAALALAGATALWLAVKTALPPDDYFGPVLARAGLRIIDAANFDLRICRLIAAALAVYAVAYGTMRRLACRGATALAGLSAATALAVYWLGFDDGIHADDRYVVRTVLLILTPAAGIAAAVTVVAAQGGLARWCAPLAAVVRRLAAVPERFVVGAMLLVTLIHAVETAKFVAAWTRYTSAVRGLATGTISDPALGDARFVSSARVRRDLDPLAWNSTTPYLSIMLAPGLAPTRLVVDPAANYFWLSCETATANERAPRSVPTDSRRLVRILACLHPHHW
jgi:hypothetical protein